MKLFEKCRMFFEHFWNYAFKFRLNSFTHCYRYIALYLGFHREFFDRSAVSIQNHKFNFFDEI